MPPSELKKEGLWAKKGEERGAEDNGMGVVSRFVN